MGHCVGHNAPGWQHGRGRGLQRGNRWGGTPQKDTAGLQEEMEVLRMQLAALGQQLAK